MLRFAHAAFETYTHAIRLLYWKNKSEICCGFKKASDVLGKVALRYVVVDTQKALLPYDRVDALK